MDTGRIEARCRVANWATIVTGFIALSSIIIFAVEVVAWLLWRRWLTLAWLTDWTPRAEWLRLFFFLPPSLLVLAAGGLMFWTCLAYWRGQERLLRHVRADLRRSR